MPRTTTDMADSDGDPRERARMFFDYARQTAATGNFEYSFELFLQGLAIDAEAVEQHQAMREASLERKASGGQAMGVLDRVRMPKAKDDKQAMLNAEKRLAYDPGNSDHLAAVLTHANRAGLYRTAAWAAELASRMDGR